MSHDRLPEICPHCAEPQDPRQTDEHVATAHADIPPCTASLDSRYGDGILTCVLRAQHSSGSRDDGDWHVSARGPAGRTVWNDSAIGATPHVDEQPRT